MTSAHESMTALAPTHEREKISRWREEVVKEGGFQSVAGTKDRLSVSTWPFWQLQCSSVG